MCSIEETLEREGKMPTYYKRFVDDTLTIMPHKASADNFLDILNQCHSSIKFTMETEPRSNSMLPFLGTQLLNKHTHVETKVTVHVTHLSSPSPRGGDPGLMWGLCKLCISKFLYFPTPGRIFSCKVPSIWRSQAPNWLQNFILVL